MGDIKDIKDTRFKKGQSGNPNGRPKKKLPTEDYYEALKILVPKALKRLGEILDDDTIPAREMLKALESVLDRQYGKPTQRIETKAEKTDYSEMTAEEMKAEAKRLSDEIAKEA